MIWGGSYYTEVRLDSFYQSYGPLSVLASLSTDVLVSMTWRWSYLLRSCSTDFYQSYWPFGNFSTLSLVYATLFAGFQWILTIPSIYFSHDPKRIILCRSHVLLLFTRVMALAIITKKKTCQHNILRIARARILIFSIWLRINVCMTWLTFEQI